MEEEWTWAVGRALGEVLERYLLLLLSLVPIMERGKSIFTGGLGDRLDDSPLVEAGTAMMQP